MRKELKSAGRLRESGLRVAVWVVVIVCHLGLLMLFLNPVIDGSDTKPLTKSKERAMLLRFFSLQTSALIVMPPTRRVFRISLPHTAASTRRIDVFAVQRQVDTPAPVQSHVLPAKRAPKDAANEADADADGGFEQRLHEAQQGSAVRGVPGSDEAVVPGIDFVNPMDQGIGAIARKAQRLFGVKSRQCIDVEAWRKLTTQALLARHISPGDVDRENEKYECSVPPGLHF